MKDCSSPLLVQDAPGAAPRRARLLLSAYACSPDHGSEPAVGWNRALEAAKIADTWVICEEARYGPPVRRYLETHGPIPGLTFSFVAKPPLLARWANAPFLGHWCYHLWQQRAYREAARLHAEIGFDLVHQVTFCGYREPGYLWKLGVPFVWGPVGGTQNYPWRFLHLAGPSGAIREAARSTMNRFQLRFSPQVRRAAKAAAAVLAANTTIERDFRETLGISPQVQLETGVGSFVAEPRKAQAGPLRILWSGELQCWKAMPLLLRALAALPREIECQVRVLGRGSLEKSLRRQAAALGVADRIEWMGFLPYREALAQYSWADILAFTSLRDTSGNVVLEALANGMPVICLDHQGVRDMVTPDCGIKAAVTTPRETVAELTAAIARLATDLELRERLSRGAIDRARHYLWSRQGERMAAVYADVLQASLADRFQSGQRAGAAGEGVGLDAHPLQHAHEEIR